MPPRAGIRQRALEAAEAAAREGRGPLGTETDVGGGARRRGAAASAPEPGAGLRTGRWGQRVLAPSEPASSSSGVRQRADAAEEGRRGVRQRLASLTETAQDAHPLADKLKSEWARGKKSAADVQKTCEAAALESSSSATHKLAKIGASGRHPQNASRQSWRTR